jgi:bacteriorhodopsin
LSPQVLAALVGAMNIAPFKYMWWFAGLIFLILIIVQLLQVSSRAKSVRGREKNGG